MEDKEIVEILTRESEEFKKLGEEHKEYDKLLAELSDKVYLTPEEEMEKKRLQKLKLLKKDKMFEIIRDYKKKNAVN